VAELLSDGVHAILVQPGASTDLAQACEQLIINPTLRGTLGEHGRTLVRERLSAVQMASEVHDLYRLLVKQSSGAEGQ
jgi:glycosyltransferase involved in cell wall biosynthesis